MYAIFSLVDSPDTARNNGATAVLASVEVNVGIICACLPVLRATLVRVADRLSPHRPSRSLVEAPIWQDVSITEIGKENTRRRENTKRSIDCSTCASASTDATGGIMRSVCIIQSRSTKPLDELPLFIPTSPAGYGQPSRKLSEVWDGRAPGVSSRITGHEIV